MARKGLRIEVRQRVCTAERVHAKKPPPADASEGKWSEGNVAEDWRLGKVRPVGDDGSIHAREAVLVVVPVANREESRAGLVDSVRGNEVVNQIPVAEGGDVGAGLGGAGHRSQAASMHCC